MSGGRKGCEGGGGKEYGRKEGNEKGAGKAKGAEVRQQKTQL